MIKTIFTRIWNERKTNTWLWLELIIVFVTLWYLIDWAYVTLNTYFQPLGFNIEHTYKLTVNTLEPGSKDYISEAEKTTTPGEDVLNIMERLRRHPEIEYVSLSHNASPYNGSNSSGSIKQDTLSFNRLIRRCTPDFFNVFQYQNIDGSGSNTLATALEEQTIIVAPNFLERRYPDGEGLLGQEFIINNDSSSLYRVSAITEFIRYGDFQPKTNNLYFAILLSDKKIAAFPKEDLTYYELCIRTKPSAPADFAETLLKDSHTRYNAGNCYIQSITSFDDIHKRFEIDTVKQMKNSAFIFCFLAVNILLGVIGTFWYRTQQRRAELGLRIALGSSKKKLYFLLLNEGIIILCAAIIPALVICYHIGKAEISDAWQMAWGMTRFLPSVAITILCMVLMIFAGISFPARQATKIQPAEVLHEE